MDITRLGEPDIEVAGLRIWVHGRQFEDAQDYWDGNWLHITAHCAEGGASVRAHGPLLHLSELSHFLKACEKLHETLRGKAELPCMEPNLSVDLAVSSPRWQHRGESAHYARSSVTRAHIPFLNRPELPSGNRQGNPNGPGPLSGSQRA